MQAINFSDTEYSDENAILINAWVDEVGHQFEQSAYFNQLSAEKQECCQYLLHGFFDYCYSYCLVAPSKLTQEAIHEIMLDVMPRKFSCDRATFEAFAPVMAQFMKFCEENHYMTETDALQKYIYHIAPQMIERSESRENWGMAKSFAMGNFYSHGEDGEDSEYTTVKYRPQATVLPYRRESPKNGRNDPCPCNSGKKYKKCCLLTAKDK